MRALHLAVEDAATRIRQLASGLQSGARDPAAVTSKLKHLAAELDDIAIRLKRAAKSL